MSNTVMKTYRINEIDFVNKLKPNMRIELANKYSYNVGYAQNNICRGEFTAEISDKNSPDAFHIRLVFVGVFSYEQGTPKEKLHVETYKMCMPFVRAAVATVTTAAGIPPVMIPTVDIDDQNIYRIEMNKPDADDMQ